jgi:hypothetical protein
MLSEIRDYLTAGNPVWDTDKVRKAMNVAIKAVETAKPVFGSEEEADAYYSEMAGFAEAVEMESGERE